MIRFPRAKINLGLQVLGKRSDGFHEIRSLLYPIGLSDILELIPDPKASETSLTSSGDPNYQTKADDLILKAFEEVSAFQEVPAHRIHIHKQIPLGSGLGGGSSDAGELIRHFAEGSDFDPFKTEDGFRQAASRIGSDVPFFLQKGAVLVSGRGEEMKPVELDLGGYQLLLIVPPFSVDTGEAYRLFEKNEGARPSLEEIVELPVSEWPKSLSNDLEEAVFQIHPELKELKEKLYQAGASYAAMTGSGSAVYGLFEHETKEFPELDGYFQWREKLPPLT